MENSFNSLLDCPKEELADTFLRLQHERPKEFLQEAVLYFADKDGEEYTPIRKIIHYVINTYPEIYNECIIDAIINDQRIISKVISWPITEPIACSILSEGTIKDTLDMYNVHYTKLPEYILEQIEFYILDDGYESLDSEEIENENENGYGYGMTENRYYETISESEDGSRNIYSSPISRYMSTTSIISIDHTDHTDHTDYTDYATLLLEFDYVPKIIEGDDEERPLGDADNW